MPEAIVQRAAKRFVTEADGIRTFHSFSYGGHYDPDNVGFGELIAFNEENVDGDQGYEQHHHANVEIVTWVLEGTLLHEDTTGHRGTVEAGTAQRLSAGTGVQHGERNASATEPLRFVQMMLRSDNVGEPAYAEHRIEEGMGLFPAVPIQRGGVRLLVARCEPARMIHIPPAALAYVHVTSGQMSAAEYMLGPGDSLRLADAGAFDLVARDRGEALIWQMQG